MGYNRACESGRDLLLNKNARYLRPVKQPRFYVFKIVPTGYGSLGGIKINYKAEVLNKDFESIPGLYATGIDANSIYGDSYIFIPPGNTMGLLLIQAVLPAKMRWNLLNLRPDEFPCLHAVNQNPPSEKHFLPVGI